MFTTPNITYRKTEPDAAEVCIAGEPKGHIRRYQNDIWTYDHDGTSFVGHIHDLKCAIKRTHRYPK